MRPSDAGSDQPSGTSPSVSRARPADAADVHPPADSIRLAGRRLNLTTAVTAIVAMASVSVALATTSHHVARPTAVSLYYGYLVAASLLGGLYWTLRRPASGFGLLLALFGLSIWIMSWQSSDWPP